MAIVMKLTWDGVTPDQYDQLRDEVKWETESPTGGIAHIAWFEGGTLRVVDAWESAESFQAFVDNRLMPGVATVGLPGEPVIEVQPAHRVFDARHGETY
jgi:hypothetical protein